MSLKSCFTLLLLTSIPAWCQPQVLLTGLRTPQKIVLTAGGNLLVTETSLNPNEGRISFVTKAGVRNTFIDGLPSGTEVTGGPSGPTAMALRERTLYVAIGGGDTERATAPGAPGRIFNPAGYSSPLFGSILELRFGADLDSAEGPFTLTAANRETLHDGAEVEIRGAGNTTVRAAVLTRMPNAEPVPGPRLYKFSNLWGLSLSDDGSELFVGDASADSLFRVSTATGRWRRVARFPQIPNPSPIGPPLVDAVPTSVRTYGSQVLVSFLTGFPFAPGNARVLAVNSDGTTEPFIYGLTSATDILYRRRTDGGNQFYVLEFSANQSASPAPPGRLLRYDSPIPQVAAAGLITPVSMAYDAATQDLYILELRGQILRLRLQN